MLNNILFRPALDSDVASCVAIESELSVEHPEASQRGFLLGGATAEEYRQFARDDIFLVATEADVVIGFLIALRSESPRFEKLKQKRDAFKLEREGVFELPNLLWGAKIAVSPSLMRRGLGTQLGKQLIQEYGHCCIVTTTASKPVRNEASYRFHLCHGFSAIGTYHLDDGVTVHDVMLREASEENFL